MDLNDNLYIFENVYNVADLANDPQMAAMIRTRKQSLPPSQLTHDYFNVSVKQTQQD